jgi:hypothetical protein
VLEVATNECGRRKDGIGGRGTQLMSQYGTTESFPELERRKLRKSGVGESSALSSKEVDQAYWAFW